MQLLDPRYKIQDTRVGRGRKKEVMEVTHSLYSLALFYFYFYFYRVYFYRVFGRFVTRRVQKHDKLFSKKFDLAHHKKCGLVFPPVFPPSALGCFARFFLIAFLGVS
jgi:hypothetical protein